MKGKREVRYVGICYRCGRGNDGAGIYCRECAKVFRRLAKRVVNPAGGPESHAEKRGRGITARPER